MKKHLNISYLIMGLLFVFAAGSCEKDKLSKEELLTDHIWKWNKITTNSANEDIQDLVVFVNALMTGATMEFRNDGSYTITVLGDSEEGTWEMADGNATLITDDDEMTIIKLTEDELVLEGDEVSDDYGTYSATMYWKK